MNAIEPELREIDGLSVRYAVSGRTPGDRSALLLSPLPESLFAYHATWSALAGHAQLIAVDLPGFGRSGFREDLMSPDAMSEFIVRIADEFELEQPDVVGPDVGTSAVLLAAVRHPGRFRTAVVGGGPASVPLELSGSLHEWVHAEDLTPYRSESPKDLVTIALNKIGVELPGYVREDYLAGYTGRQLVEQMGYLRAYRSDLPLLAGLLDEVATPVQIIAGRRDHLVPLSNAEYLHDRLPESKLEIFDVGHYVWEEAPDAYAEVVADWWLTH